MYRMEVKPSLYGYVYMLFFGELHIGHGFRPTEALANRDGADDLSLCRLFGIGRDPIEVNR